MIQSDSGTHQETSTGGPSRQRKRTHASSACNQCRQRKVRCDAEEPVCHRCTLGGLECSYGKKMDGRKTLNSKRYVASLEDRIKVLEAELAEARKTSPSSIASPLPGLRDEAAVEEPLGAGIVSIGPDGDLRYVGATSSFFRTVSATSSMPVMLPIAPEVASAPSSPPQLPHFSHPPAIPSKPPSFPNTSLLSYLGPPILPVSLSPLLHDHIIRLAFDFQISFGYVVDEALFRRAMRENPAQRTYDYSPFLHLVLLATGCRFLDDPPEHICSDPLDPSTRGDIFASAAGALILDEGRHPKLSTIRGLLALSSFMVGRSNDRLAWMYQGLAVFISQDFGLHLKCDQQINELGTMGPVLDTARRTTFWTCSIVDTWWSAYLCRASTVLREEIDQPLPVVPEDVILDAAATTPFVKTAFSAHAQLAVIGAQVISQLYVRRTSAAERQRDLIRLDRELEAWWSEIPSVLCVDPSKADALIFTHLITLNNLAYTFQILLHRPFVVRVGQTEASATSIAKCELAANNIVSLLRVQQERFGAGKAPVILRNSAFAAGTILLLLSVGLDILPSVSTDTETAELLRRASANVDLQFVLGFLREFAMTWEMGGKSADALQALVDEFGVLST